MVLRRLSATLVLLLLPAVAGAAAPGVWAITGGTVHPVSGPAIPGGMVVIRNGLVESAGPAEAIPADAAQVDATGMHVYPGLIDAQTSWGLSGFKESDAGGDAMAVHFLKPTEDEDGARLATGVTTVVTAPTAGIFNGWSALVNLGDGPLESRVVKSPAALQVSFNPRPAWTWPDSLMGVIAYLRQNFLDARHLITAREIYQRSPAGLQRPVASAEVEALAPAVRRELPVVFVADSELMLRRAWSLARELELRPVFSGARQGWAVAGSIRDVPMLVSVRWPQAPAAKEDREEQPLRVIRERQLAPTTPAALAKNGVPFALVSGPGKAGDFLPGIRKAISNGLSADDALRAVTLTPAKIFGVERQLGTLEKGRIANLVISDKPIFDKEAKVMRVFVDGREIRLPKEEKKAAQSAPSAIDGTWSITVRAPQGNLAFNVTLRAESGRLTGTWSGDRGSGEVRGGTFEAERFEFTISTAAQNEAETTDWVFAGTLTGDSMSGSVATTLGRFDFSGSRSK